VAPVEDQHPIQQFAADGADPSFSDCVRPECQHRCAQDTIVLASEHGVEDAGERAVVIPDQVKAPG
jgi:hypothetical protein